MKYNSPPTTLENQLEILIERGLHVENHKKALAFLSRAGYYRFCGYALHFEEFEDRKRTHKYKKGSSFEQVKELYDFDSGLRKILFSAVEKIEIAFRTQLCMQLALDTGDSHWPLNPAYFKPGFEHEKFVNECRNETNRSREIFITNYREKYSEPDLPASWMLVEIVSFGTWSRLYSKLKEIRLKKDVAGYFDVPHYVFQSWIHSLTVVRNLCAHHSRIWNRSLTIKPAITRRMEKYYPEDSIRSKRIVLVLDVISELLKPIDQYTEFIKQLNTLIDSYKSVPVESMGLIKRKIDIKNGVRE